MSAPSLRISLTKEERTILVAFLGRIDASFAALDSAQAHLDAVTTRRAELGKQITDLRNNTSVLNGDWSAISAAETQLAALTIEQPKAEAAADQAGDAVSNVIKYALEPTLEPILRREHDTIMAEITAALLPFTDSQPRATQIARSTCLALRAARCGGIGSSTSGVSVDRARHERDRIKALLNSENHYL
jgi:hypothetical protein